MNWVRKSVLARRIHEQHLEIGKLREDHGALERRVTEIEIKLFSATPVSPAPRSTKGPDLSPLGNFEAKKEAARAPLLPSGNADILRGKTLVELFGGGSQ